MRVKDAMPAGALLAMAALFGIGILPAYSVKADPPAKVEAPLLDNEVIALLKQANEAYAKLKSYRHTEVFAVTQKAGENEQKQTQKFLFAVERPNKFVYKPEKTGGDAAVSDGKTYLNYHAQTGEYVKTAAPADYKNINIVDDMIFPPATFLPALALHGDILTDKNLAAILAQAKVGAKAEENGKSYDTLVIKDEKSTFTIYLETGTHLFHKTTREIKTNGGAVTVSEQLEDVKLDKPVESALFTFTPPQKARQVAKFTDPAATEEAAIEAALKALAAKYEGKPASDFTVLDRNGKEIKLSSLKGKVVALNFWSSRYEACKVVLPIMQEIHDRYASKGVAVMAVNSFEPRMDYDHFLTHNPQYTLPMLRDPAGKDDENTIAHKLFGVDALPTTLFLDKKGAIHKYTIGVHSRAYYLDILKEMGVSTDAK